MMAMLETRGLVKTFKNFSLGPIDLSLDTGCAMGLVGANGAGKTTLFRSVIGTVRRSQGAILVQGNEVSSDSAEWRQHVGYVGDFTPFFQYWSGSKNLHTFSQFYPDWSQQRAEELARRLDLDLRQSAKNYSTGQRTKLAIVIALSYNPRLLLLDEPTAGLDPVSRMVFLELLFEQMESEQVAILYATHHISEIEQLADRLVFLNNGQIVHDAVKEDLIESWCRITFRSENELPHIPHVTQQKSEHPRYEVISDAGDATLKFLNTHGAYGVETSRLSIEQIAVQIMKQSAQVASHEQESSHV
jgi:ABC-2 type transport system ATP-binding protein